MMMQAKARVRWDAKNRGPKVSFILFGSYYVLFSAENEPWQYLVGQEPFAQPAFSKPSPHFGATSKSLGPVEALTAFQLQILNQRKQCPQVTSHKEYLRTALPG